MQARWRPCAPGWTASRTPGPGPWEPSADDPDAPTGGFGAPGRRHRRGRRGTAGPARTHLQVPLRGTCPASRGRTAVRFTVTPLGGARSDTARVVDAIVRYLQPPPAPAPAPPRVTDPSEVEGPAAYYADQANEPGRWLGRGARAAGLAGHVNRSAFASVLSGRDPHSGERLITAQGSARRRPTLGVGAPTRLDSDGAALYGPADAAAALGVSAREIKRMLQVGSAIAVASWLTAVVGTATAPPAAGQRAVTPPGGPPVTPPGGNGGLGRVLGQPGGSYLVPVMSPDGSRWVRQTELSRCQAARAEGPDAETIRSLGDPGDQLSLAEAARLVGVTTRYLRRLARYWEANQARIEAAVAAGRRPRRAFLAAHRGTGARWLVTRQRLVEFIERRRPPAVRVGYDLTLTTEKSLGVLALLSDPPVRDVVLGAIQAGNDWAMGWLEDTAAAGRLNGKTVKAHGWMVASFRHLTSRALDPFPHHHNVVANTVRLADGTHRALDARGLYRHAQAASALATAEMRHQLSGRLGVRWRPGRSGGWEVAGIGDRVIAEFSQRRNEIDEALIELEEAIGRGAHPAEIEHVVLRTRPAKNHTPAGVLVDTWRERATRCGLDPDGLAGLCAGPPPRQVVDTDALFASLAGPEGICAGGSVFTRAQAMAALANHPIDSTDGPAQPLLGGADQLLEFTDAFLACPHVVRLTDGDDPLYGTREMLAVQGRIVDRYRAGLHRGAHLVGDSQLADTLAAHAHLSEEQRRLVTAWCQSGHRIQAAIGRAGAGKTTTVAACAQAWAAAGYRVVGAAVKGEATRTLAAATGIDCETVAWYLAHPDPARTPLDARTILVVDEASTLADRDLDALIGMAAATGASLRLIGDPAQHGAIAAGGMFRVLCDQHPHHTPELTSSHRLTNPHDAAAAHALRDGHIDAALDHLAAAGHLHVVADDLALYRHILGRWWDAHRRGQDHPMVDRRNRTRHQLNRLAHLLRWVHGELGPQSLPASANRRFAVGDRVCARAPNRHLHVPGDPHAYVRNGALGTITAIGQDTTSPDRDTLTVDFDGIGPIEVPRSFFDHHLMPSGRRDAGIDHAYALTSYAVQGATHPVSTSRIDPTATRAEAYVDITRGRHANHLYLTTGVDPLDGETLPRIPPAPADVAVADRLARSTSEITAWELTHPGPRTTGPGLSR
ncbi:MAG: hypothetical protein D6683_05165 [Actinomyces sp.]|nr:MAG: hypothetical protein D6683_05165 [Actinomyces sp.]